MHARLTVTFGTIAALLGLPAVAASETPVPLQSTERRYAAGLDDGGGVVRGVLQSTRIVHADDRGRPLRWEQRDADGTPRLIWVGIYLTDGFAPDRAAYWSADQLLPLTELYVTSSDGRIQDVLYAEHGDKPRRQLRQYLDAAGREIFQEYFAPRSQRKYSEEVYRYDDSGNELQRTWRRLDGKARRETRLEILATDEHGHWTRRLVHRDGALIAIDQRSIEYATTTRPRPPATSGPVEPSTEILPIPFAPGVVALRGSGENTLTFTPDGKTVLFTRYEDDWKTQRGYLARWRDGAWREPEPVPFAETMYNAALSENGQQIIYCTRDDSLAGARVLVTQRTGDGWSDPIDLTESEGLMGSYFRLLTDGTLYFHRDGDLFRGVLRDGSVSDVTALAAPINTPDGVEFGAWVDTEERRIIFTRAVDDAPQRTGVFVAFRRDGVWTEPARLPIPYGWSVVLSPDGEDLVYVVDGDICRVPTVLISVWLDGPDL